MDKVRFPRNKHGGWESFLKHSAKDMGLPINTFLGGLRGGAPQDWLMFENPAQTNLCYVNAAFQSLACLKIFNDYFVNASIVEEEHKVTTEVKKLLMNRGSVQNLTYLRKLVLEANKKQDSNRQNDAEEFILFILKALNDEGHTDVVHRFSDGENLINMTFSACLSCHNIKQPITTSDTFSTMLLIPIKENDGQKIDLQKLIENKYSKTAPIEKVKCTECNTEGNGLENTTLYRTPEILIVKLHKGTGVTVVPNVTLNLPNNQSYKLRSCVDHLGKNTTDGHYITCIKHENQYIKIDDARLFENVTTITSTNNYIYVYEREENLNISDQMKDDIPDEIYVSDDSDDDDVVIELSSLTDISNEEAYFEF